MKNFKLYDVEYEVKKVTAIAECDLEKGEEMRQEALLITSFENGEKNTFVVFGWDIPADLETFSEMCKDHIAWENDYYVLKTVK